MRGYSVVIDWQSKRLTWRTTRMRVVATTEDDATEISVGKLKGRKDFNTMRKLIEIIWTIVALSPIFALGYMLGIKLLEQ